MRSTLINKAIILGGHINGLGLVYSLSEIGVFSIVLDFQNSLAGASRWSDEVICPNPSSQTIDFITFMLKLGRSFSDKPIIFATNDIWLKPILENRKELESYFIFPMSEWSVIEGCFDKVKLADRCVQLNIPHPSTSLIENTIDLRKSAESFQYPCFLKPVITIGFSEKLGWPGRNIVLDSAAHLQSVADELDKAQFSDRSVIIQEKIPGNIKELYTFTSFSDKNGDVLSWSTGYKIRQYPSEAGTITSGKVERRDDLAKIGIEMIKKLGFHGIANSEFKRDSISGEFKLIEINARPGMWNRSALATGINLPAISYCYSLGLPLEYNIASDETVIWKIPVWDMVYHFKSRSTLGDTIFSSFVSWFSPLRGKKIDAIFRLSDLGPTFRFIRILWRRVLKWLVFGKN